VLSGCAFRQFELHFRKSNYRTLGGRGSTWNLLIDVVAQSGHYKPNAQGLRDDFVVEGEQLTGCTWRLIGLPGK
jgi:hypothetical protein